MLAGLGGLHLICLLLALYRRFDCSLGIRIRCACSCAGRTMVEGRTGWCTASCSQAVAKLCCCCLPPETVQQWLEAFHESVGRVYCGCFYSTRVEPARVDASTMTLDKGLYLYRYRADMQEPNLLGGRNAALTATAEARRLGLLTPDPNLASSWETTPAVRAASEDGDGVPLASPWGFSQEKATQADAVPPTAAAAEAGTLTVAFPTADSATELCPTVVDARHPHSSLDLAYYSSYPAAGSQFSGPWRCVQYAFYRGAAVQVEFDRAHNEWEPMVPLLPEPHRTSTYTKRDLCALFVTTTDVPRLPAPPPLSRDDAAADGRAAAKLSADDGGAADDAAASRRLCYLVSAGLDGETLTVSEGYSNERGGHYGETWTLERVGHRPPWTGLHGPFAGTWRCVEARFYSGVCLELEPNGDATRWALSGEP